MTRSGVSAADLLRIGGFTTGYGSRCLQPSELQAWLITNGFAEVDGARLSSRRPRSPS